MEDLQDYVVYANGKHLVQKFLECRINPDKHHWDVLVEWIGLDVAENSWEPASILPEEVPLLFKRWVASEPWAEALVSFVHNEGQEGERNDGFGIHPKVRSWESFIPFHIPVLNESEKKCFFICTYRSQTTSKSLVVEAEDTGSGVDEIRTISRNKMMFSLLFFLGLSITASLKPIRRRHHIA